MFELWYISWWKHFARKSQLLINFLQSQTEIIITLNLSRRTILLSHFISSSHLSHLIFFLYLLRNTLYFRNRLSYCCYSHCWIISTLFKCICSLFHYYWRHWGSVHFNQLWWHRILIYWNDSLRFIESSLRRYFWDNLWLNIIRLRRWSSKLMCWLHWCFSEKWWILFDLKRSNI